MNDDIVTKIVPPGGRDATLRARNRRTGLILATVALVFFVAVILKYALARH